MPEVFEPGELLEMFDNPPPEVVARAIELGLVTPLGDGRFEVPVPTLLRAGIEIGQMGVPLERLIDVLDALLRHARGVSRSFIELFLEGVWRPFEQAGEPADQWPQIRQALERLRPIASDALYAAFQATMKGAVEEAFGREMESRAGAREEAV